MLIGGKRSRREHVAGLVGSVLGNAALRDPEGERSVWKVTAVNETRSISLTAVNLYEPKNSDIQGC